MTEPRRRFRKPLSTLNLAVSPSARSSVPEPPPRARTAGTSTGHGLLAVFDAFDASPLLPQRPPPPVRRFLQHWPSDKTNQAPRRYQPSRQGSRRPARHVNADILDATKPTSTCSMQPRGQRTRADDVCDRRGCLFMPLSSPSSPFVPFLSAANMLIRLMSGLTMTALFARALAATMPLPARTHADARLSTASSILRETAPPRSKHLQWRASQLLKLRRTKRPCVSCPVRHGQYICKQRRLRPPGGRRPSPGAEAAARRGRRANLGAVRVAELPPSPAPAVGQHAENQGLFSPLLRCLCRPLPKRLAVSLCPASPLADDVTPRDAHGRKTPAGALRADAPYM